jgi:putative nucleotidyltransferase with HDIG domain
MPKESDIVIKASEFVSALFKERLAEYLVYHKYEHSEMVSKVALKIAKHMKLGEDGIEIVMIAGWLHDIGYTEIYRGHEEVSIRIATEFLRKENYPQEKIQLVVGCIRATKIPQKPKNILEEILADADLSGLGRKSFFDDTELLHYEWEKALGKKYSGRQWMQQNLELLSGHKYFTRFARRKYSDQQNDNIRAVRKILSKLAAQDENIFETQHTSDDFEWENTWGSSLGADTEKNSQEIYNTVPETNSGNDTKAQIMVLASTVMIIVILFSLMVIISKGVFGILEIPFILLFFISILSIIFAILSARPRIADSKITKIDIRSRYLQFSYNFFLYGIPLSIVLFIILFLL